MREVAEGNHVQGKIKVKGYETVNLKRSTASLGQPIEARTKGPRVSSIRRSEDEIVEPKHVSKYSETCNGEK